MPISFKDMVQRKQTGPARKKTSRQVKVKTAAKTSSLVTKQPYTRLQRTKNRVQAFLGRRPHRTFQRTMRRDYVRSLSLPGYIAFTAYVFRTLRQRWRTMLTLAAVFIIISALLVGIASQEMYSTLTSTLQETSKGIFTGGWGEIGKAGLLFAAIASGNIGDSLTEAQQIYTILIFLLLWLTTVWLLRAQLAGRSPRVRDALYNAGSPIIPTLLVAVLFIIQLIPAALAIIAYNAALTTNFLANGVIAMVFFLVALLLCLLTLYWITSTFIALVVATLPGMYPWQAIRTAGDLVVGRRFRILLRLAWLALIIVLLWVIVMLPIILVTTWLQSLMPWMANVPIIPVILLVLGTISTVFVASYVYLLYRKVVDDDAAPA